MPEAHVRALRCRTLLLLIERRGSRTSEIHASSVGEAELARAGAQRTVLGLESDDGDLRARWKRITVPAKTKQDGRRSAFDLPSLDGAVGLLHIDVQPGVRVHPLH